LASGTLSGPSFFGSSAFGYSTAFGGTIASSVVPLVQVYFVVLGCFASSCITGVPFA